MSEKLEATCDAPGCQWKHSLGKNPNAAAQAWIDHVIAAHGTDFLLAHSKPAA